MKVRVSRNRAKREQHGFTLLQAMIVLTVAMIVSGATVLSIRAGRPYLQLANSAHTLAGYLERARADSVRRRPSPGQESKIEILDDKKTYRVTMGFGGSGTLSSRDFTVEGLVRFRTDPITVAFDWRGRPTSGTEATFLLVNENNDRMQVDVTGSGDVTVGSEIYQDEAIPNINLNENVSGDVAPDPLIPPDPLPTATPPVIDENPTPTPPVDDTTPTPTPTPKGNAGGNGGNPHASPTPTPTATSTPTPTPTPVTDPTPIPCVASISSPTLSIKKNGGSDTVTVATTGQAGTVTVSAPPNLTITPTSPSISFAGTVVFTIRSNDTSRGIFTVTFTTPCGKVSTAVTVVNNLL